MYINTFKYTPKDVSCQLCTEYVKKLGCTALRCPWLAERIEAGVVGYESLVGGMLTKEEYASYKAKYTKQAEDIRESVRVLKEKLTEVLENRSERNRWISQFTQFSTLETLDRRALIHMVQSIRVRGKKELDITFTHEDEYKKALQLLALAAQQKDYEQRKVG